MAKKLIGLLLNEISLVDKGANPGAHVSIFKRKESETMTVEEIKKQLEAQTAETNFFKGLSGEAKAHYDGLKDDAAKDAFRKMSAEDQTKAVAETVAKSKKVENKDLPQDVQKALKDSETALEKARKDRETDQARIAKLEDETQTARLTARVHKEFPNAKGTVEEKVATLKAIDAQTDEAVKKTLLASLQTSEDFAKRMATETGHRAAPDANSAEAQLQKMAEEVAKKDGVAVEVALTKVYKDPANAKLAKAAIDGE